MSTPVPAILGIFTVAGLSLIVTGCEPLENVLTVMNNGTPVPGGPSVSMYVSPVEDVEVAEVALEASSPSEPCVVPAHLFRSMQCDEGGQLIPIR